MSWATGQRQRDGKEGEEEATDADVVPAMWVHTVGSSDRLRVENQWSLNGCS